MARVETFAQCGVLNDVVRAYWWDWLSWISNHMMELQLAFGLAGHEADVDSRFVNP